MTNHLNKALSVTNESLTDFISEQLSNRLHIDDFVRIDMPEAQDAGTDDNSPKEMKTEDQSKVGYRDIGNVVQCVTHTTSSEDVAGDQSDSDSDLEGMLEAEYVDNCIKNKDKTFIVPKIKYSLPHRLKVQNRAINYNEKMQLSKNHTDRRSKEQKNNLPKMKFDATTTAVLNMLANSRHFGQYNELIGTGKNSVVFHAQCCGTNGMPYAVKIYKTSKDEDRNKVIYKKVQMEFQHLNIIKWTRPFYFFSASAPFPLKAMKNVIVMRFIGNMHDVCPSIQDLPLETDQEMYNAIIEFMDKCYNIANLVHGKLSPSKILVWPEKKPCFIGWSHSVKKDHPLALTKLVKDCHFVTEFYKRRGLSVKSAIDLFHQITGQKITSEELLQITQGKNLYDKYERNPNRKSANVVKQTINRFKL